MDWIIAGSLMFLSSVLMYLLVRKASLLGIASQYTNLSMFLIPTGIYTIMLSTHPADINISIYALIILIISAFFSATSGISFR